MRRPLLPVLLLGIALLAACGRGGPGSGDASGASADSTAVADSTVTGDKAAEDEAAVPVEVVELETGPIESVIRSTATLEAETRVIVLAEASRRVVELLVEEGDRVKKGQLLARLQDAEQASALAKARTLFDQAEREWKRQETLEEKGLTTDKAFNDALAELEQRRIAVEDAEREMGYTRIRATITGTVTQRFIRQGDQVNPGMETFEIIDFESLVARIFVPERELGSLRPGQLARVYAAAIRPEPYAATVDRVAPIVDARTGTVKVTVDIGGQPGLRPGLYVDVELVTAREDAAVLIPKRAVLFENDRAFVFRVRSGRAERVRVLPVMEDTAWVRPAEGFAAGDSVVVAGQASLKDEALVEIVERTAESGS